MPALSQPTWSTVLRDFRGYPDSAVLSNRLISWSHNLNISTLFNGHGPWPIFSVQIYKLNVKHIT